MNKLTYNFLRGIPTELTDASPETAELRNVLETHCTFGDIDIGGDVYWDSRNAVAVCVPPVDEALLLDAGDRTGYL